MTGHDEEGMEGLDRVECRDAQHLIARGTLSGADAAALAAHVGICVDCREARTGQQAVARLLRERPDVPVPPGFAARVAARLEEDRSWLGVAEWRTWTLRLVPVMAALALAVALTVGRTAAGPESSVEGSTTDPATVLMTSQISGDALLDLTLTGTVPTAGVPTGTRETEGR
jgi:hypothetical protein